jgi:hypothetical protein
MKTKLLNIKVFLKELLNNIFALIGALFLILTAILIVWILTPFALLWRVWVSIFHDKRKAREIIRGVNIYFISIASAIDKFGNCAFGGFLTASLLIQGKYPFGQNSETVSEVLGWAEKHRDLNRKGLVLLSLLNMLDKNHCAKAQKHGLELAYKKIDNYRELKKFSL